jgi:hypothetical protein
VFLNRVLREMCGPNKENVPGNWMKLHVKQFRDLHSSPNSFRAIKSGRIILATYVVRACRVLVGKPGRKRLLGRSGSGWDCRVKMCFKNIKLNDLDWMYLA